MAFNSLHIFAYVISTSALMACANETQAPDIDADMMTIGYVDSGCFVTSQAGLSSGDQLSVHDIASGKMIVATISSANLSGGTCGTFQTTKAQAANPDLHFHALTEPLDFAVAVKADPSLKSTIEDLTYSSCTTREGLRYRAIAGETGKVVWEGYQPLGYDTESDCED